MTTRVHWSNRCYRVSHSVLRLHPGMLTGQYEREIDGYIVRFDRDYIAYRIALLLKPLKESPLGDISKLLADTTEQIEREWATNTQPKDDLSQNIPQ